MCCGCIAQPFPGGLPAYSSGGKARSPGNVPWALVAFSHHLHWKNKFPTPAPHLIHVLETVTEEKWLWPRECRLLEDIPGQIYLGCL